MGGHAKDQCWPVQNDKSQKSKPTISHVTFTLTMNGTVIARPGKLNYYGNGHMYVVRI